MEDLFRSSDEVGSSSVGVKSEPGTGRVNDIGPRELAVTFESSDGIEGKRDPSGMYRPARAVER